MKGASASFARRRAISVLPTPVGPIIRMFFGVISARIDSSTCWRRQRLRSAIATARLALPWPTMCRSSSETISCGVIALVGNWRGAASRGTASVTSVERFDDMVLVRVDAELAGDLERLLDDVPGRELGVLEQRACRGVGVRPAGADRDQAVLGLQHVAVAGDDQRRLL